MRRSGLLPSALLPSAVLLSALLPQLGCADDDSAPTSAASGEPAEQDRAAAAGVVRDVVGKVTARRAGTKEYRDLEVNSEVYAEDTITTAKGASIAIYLHHNGALLALSGDKSRQLKRSAAWSAPSGASAGLLDKESASSTAAAGRHAEREAAETRATASLVPGDTAAPPEPEPAAKAPPPKPRPPVRRTSRKQSAKPPPPPRDEAPPRPPPAAQALAVPVPDRLDRSAIQAGIKAVKGTIMKCGVTHQATGVVRTKFQISPAGKVTSVEVSSSPDPELTACVVAALKTAHFPSSKNGQSVSYPFAFR